ncbi:hypothetical protein XMV225_003123 [Aliiroseovarius sp. xm-v-225]|nr:hypothetical protein [Aliiroseovarius sp. xm-m-378]NRP66801.1 hypothetical protein [Aliiroseovarius sp. xm-v-225]NRP93865.1 hypothetical protein [Aliiroseovarius sp. xm-a-134]
MLRTTVTKFLSLVLILSLIGSLGSLYRLYRTPGLALFAERPIKLVEAEVSRALFSAAEEGAIDAKLNALLSETPRNWFVIDAITDVANDRSLEISSDTRLRVQNARDEDHGIINSAIKCSACLLDISKCEITNVFLCRSPIELTILGDVSELTRQGKNYVTGNDIDKIDLVLSSVGLGATVLAPLTGGSSISVKIGSGTVKIAKQMGRLSPKLLDYLGRAAGYSVRNGSIARSKPKSILSKLQDALHTKRLEQIRGMSSDVWRAQENVGHVGALHLIGSVDTPRDAKAVARLSDVSRGSTVGVIEILGKNDVVRIALKFGDEALAFIVSVSAFLLSVLMLILNSFLWRFSTRMRTALEDNPELNRLT